MRTQTLLATTLLALGLAAPAWAAAGDAGFPELTDIMHFAGDYAPAGWADLNGAALTYAQHPVLFACLGGAFGASPSVDKPVTFNLPLAPGTPPATPAVPRPVMCLDGVFPPAAGSSAAGTVGMIRLMVVGRRGLPDNWVPCHGQAVPVTEITAPLKDLVQEAFGPATDATFQAPNLPDVVPGTLAWAICTLGSATAEGFVGEVRRWPAAVPVPRNWLPCDGRRMPIATNQAFYAITGGRYGQDASTFNLPNRPDEAGVRWIICTMGIFPSRF